MTGSGVTRRRKEARRRIMLALIRPTHCHGNSDHHVARMSAAKCGDHRDSENPDVTPLIRAAAPATVRRPPSKARAQRWHQRETPGRPPAVRPSPKKAPPNRARLYFWRRAIEPDSPGVLTSGPPARAVRASPSPRQPAVKERTRCPPLARRWRRIRSASSAWRSARRAVADPAAAHAEWLPHGQSLSIRD